MAILEKIDLIFQETLSAERFTETFTEYDSFKDQLSKGDIINLKFLLASYEEEELYLECLIIKEIIDSKTNKKQ
jgi:hypothetical protein